MTLSSAMNMTAENGDDASGVLQGPLQPRQRLRCFEVEPIRPY